MAGNRSVHSDELGMETWDKESGCVASFSFRALELCVFPHIYLSDLAPWKQNCHMNVLSPSLTLNCLWCVFTEVPPELTHQSSSRKGGDACRRPASHGLGDLE